MGVERVRRVRLLGAGDVDGDRPADRRRPGLAGARGPQRGDLPGRPVLPRGPGGVDLADPGRLDEPARSPAVSVCDSQAGGAGGARVRGQRGARRAGFAWWVGVVGGDDHRGDHDLRVGGDGAVGVDADRRGRRRVRRGRSRRSRCRGARGQRRRRDCRPPRRPATGWRRACGGRVGSAGGAIRAAAGGRRGGGPAGSGGPRDGAAGRARRARRAMGTGPRPGDRCHLRTVAVPLPREARHGRGARRVPRERRPGRSRSQPA